jgi:stage II sporulation protein AA (anti-sigma F factor antagonist)
MIDFATRREGARVTLIVRGEVDLDTAEELRDAVLACFREAPAQVNVDVTGVSFLNSSGVNALLAGAREADGRDVRFTVSNPQPAVRKVIATVGLNDVFGI